MQLRNKTFCIITLGCRTNICESDVVANQLIKEKATMVDNVNDANVCIINTCCVTAKAESKSKYFVNQAIRSNTCKLIVVIGCLSQMNTKLFGNSKIGIIVGNNNKNNVINLIKQYDGKQKIINVRNFNKNDTFENYDIIDSSNKTRAFVKIQDGCDFMCSYCVIPFVRGRQRSLPHKQVLAKLKELVKNNYKEIILTGVNTAGYRENKDYGFLQLLQDIDKLNGDFRVRISSLEPFQINQKIINVITDNPKRWCQQFHICIQSGCDETIKQMKRKYTINEFQKLCAHIRAKNELASITTDCIIGFPTETKNNFMESYKNIEKIKFANIHIFPFSARPFTLASKLPTSINDFEKKQRFIQVDKLRKQLTEKYLKKFIGKTVNVLFEKSRKIG
jgi:threonylcarbamoyladenosine tRNA methylthiotransferase MtaB